VLQYRCDILKKIYDNYSRYERLWWRHITWYKSRVRKAGTHAGGSYGEITFGLYPGSGDLPAFFCHLNIGSVITGFSMSCL
jgi:hypothetical protein